MPDSKTDPTALFDLDGTLCDYEKAMRESMAPLMSPYEPKFNGRIDDDAPKYLQARADLIRADSSWWENLEKLKLGWDILEIAKNLEFEIMILTQGTRKNSIAWLGKKRWVDKNLGPDTNLTITRNKGNVYGMVLVDDYPKYIEGWLEHRKRGLVIMPANEFNQDFSHPQVIRYDGTNLGRIENAMALVRHRKIKEKIDFTQI